MKMRDQVRISACSTAKTMIAIASRTTIPCATAGASARSASIDCFSSHGIASENALSRRGTGIPSTIRPSSGRSVRREGVRGC